ncbi:MAG: hypothetical protein ACP5NC_07380 [Nitrososphaeria archaeon]
MRAEYMEVPVDDAFPDEGAMVRFYYDVEDLVQSIRSIGQIHPGLAYMKGGKYCVYVGIRRLLAVKELYRTDGSPALYKALVYPEKPPSYYQEIAEENSKRTNLTGLEKVNMYIKIPDARSYLNPHDVRTIKSIYDHIDENTLKYLSVLAEIEHRARSPLSLEEVEFLFSGGFSLTEIKLLAYSFTVEHVSVARIRFLTRDFIRAKAEVRDRHLMEVTGLTEEELKSVSAPARILVTENMQEKPEITAKPAGEPRRVPESKEEPKEEEKQQVVLLAGEYAFGENNGEKFILVRAGSGIRVHFVEDGQLIEAGGMKLKVKYV